MQSPWIEATVPCPAPPTWAVLERAVLDAIDAAHACFTARALRPDGSLRWNEAHASRLRTDAFYEAAQNWPLAYALGGGEALLDDATRLWEGVTRQLARHGLVADEFPVAEDWFHLGEGSLLLYGLCAATPADERRWSERAARFAALYAGGRNWDAERRQIRASHTGSGPLGALPPGCDPAYRWGDGMARYGLPLDDVPGLRGYDDLRSEEGRERLATALRERAADGDVVQNLAATTLATVAYARTGDERLREWVLEYVETWAARARERGGELPDNVGPSGSVGERFDGRPYGGYYGWTWPHGLYNVAMVATTAAANALLLSGDAAVLELPRTVLAQAYERGEQRRPDQLDASLHERLGELPPAARETIFAIPYRRRTSGWIDWQPPHLAYPATLWALSMDPRDGAQLDRLRDAAGYDWNAVVPFRNKEEHGHEAPWLRFLAGANPDYPQEALRLALAQVRVRVDQLRAEDGDPETTALDKHHWTSLNPVATEVLLQLTTGSPQALYNAGLPACRVAYRDRARGRPGLPRDVAALVTGLDAHAVELELVNLDPARERELAVLGGLFGEHEPTAVEYDAAADDDVAYPGRPAYDGGPIAEPATRVLRRELDGGALNVRLRAGARVRLRLEQRRFARPPTVARGVAGAGVGGGDAGGVSGGAA